MLYNIAFLLFIFIITSFCVYPNIPFMCIVDNFSSYIYIGSLYLSVTPKFYTKVLHQTLNSTAELWCKTFSRIKVDLVLHRT